MTEQNVETGTTSVVHHVCCSSFLYMH